MSASEKNKNSPAAILLALFLLFIGAVFVGWLFFALWNTFKSLEVQLAATLVTAFTTIVVATISLVWGKYLERTREIESNSREKKVEIYDDILREIFALFHSSKKTDSIDDSDALVNFLWEWQRRVILWGGQDVLNKYIEWSSDLKDGKPSLNSLYLLEEFFLEIRKDLGHKNTKITKGSFIKIIMKNPEIFFFLYSQNPNATLEDLGKLEKDLENAASLTGSETH